MEYVLGDDPNDESSEYPSYVFVGNSTPSEEAPYTDADLPLLSFTSSSSSCISSSFFLEDSTEENLETEEEQEQEKRQSSLDHERNPTSRLSSSVSSVEEMVYDAENVTLRYEQEDQQDGDRPNSISPFGYHKASSLMVEEEEEDDDDDDDDDEDDEQDEELPHDIAPSAAMSHLHTPGTFVFSQYHESRFIAAANHPGNSKGFTRRKRGREPAVTPPLQQPRCMNAIGTDEVQKGIDVDQCNEEKEERYVALNEKHAPLPSLPNGNSPLHSAVGTLSSKQVLCDGDGGGGEEEEPSVPSPHIPHSQLPEFPVLSTPPLQVTHAPLPPYTVSPSHGVGPHPIPTASALAPQTQRKASTTPSGRRTGSSQSVLLAKAAAWCPWSSFDASPSTLNGWGLPSSVVEQWNGLGVHQLHLWQRACLFDFCEHVATGLQRCAEALEQRGMADKHSRLSLPTSTEQGKATARPLSTPPLGTGKGEQGSATGTDGPVLQSFSSSHTGSSSSQRQSWWWSDYPSHNLVYSAPTSGGKALLSDILMLRTLLGVTENGGGGQSYGYSGVPHSSGVPSGVSSAMKNIASNGTQLHSTAGDARRVLSSSSPTANSFGLPSAGEPGGTNRRGERRRIAIYALPFVALAEERARHLETVCANLTEVRVVCLAGGAPLLLLEDRLNNQHMVYVCTNEKAHALWRELENRGRLHEVAVVVVDEVHYLSDNSRGYVLELFLTSVLRFAASTTPIGRCEANSDRKSDDDDAILALLESTHPLQLLVTSATISNPQTLAKWCGNAFLFLTDHRPVPLQCYSVLQGHVYNGQQRVVRELADAAQSAREGRRALIQMPAAQVPGIEDPHSPASVLRHPLAMQPRLEEEEISLLLALEGLKEQYQVLLFVPTRKEAESTARRLATAVAMSRIMKRDTQAQEGDAHISQQAEENALSSVPLVEFRDSTPGVKEGLQFTTMYGQVGFHHAGLGSKDRVLLEQGYRQGVIWALCCTTTLSTGMNLPCRRVIFTAPRIGISPLDTLTFMQAAGRAGRVGLDPYGEAYVIGKPSERALLRQLAQNRLPPIESNFAPEKRGVARVLLDGMASYTCRGAEPSGVSLPQGLGPREVHRVLLGTLYAVVEREKQCPDSEYAYEAGEAPAAPRPPGGSADVFTAALFEATKHALVLLESNRFITFEVESSCFTLTPLGQATAASLFSPEDALFVLQDLQRSTRQFCLADDLHLLYHCTPLQHDLEPDWHALYHYWGPQLFQGPTAPIIAQVVEVEERTLAAFAMAPPPRRSKHPVVVRCRRLYGALILSETVRERAPADVAQQFGLYGGAPDVLRLMEAAALFASSLARFAHALNWWYLPPLFTIMVVRLRRGVAPELLPLMEIEGLTPWRARELFDKGYRTVRSVVGATAAELEAVFSKHSLQGFQLAAGEQHGMVEAGEDNGEAVSWCRGTDYREVVRQLQHRARLVLVREAKDLETYLLADDVSGEAKQGGIGVDITVKAGGDVGVVGDRDAEVLESPPHTPPRPSYGRVQLNAEQSPWGRLSPSSRSSVRISPLVQNILQGSPLLRSTTSLSSTHTAVCLVESTDACQVQLFSKHLSRLLRFHPDSANNKTEEEDILGRSSTSRHPEETVTMISLRAVPERMDNCRDSLMKKRRKNDMKGSSPTYFTLIIGVYQGVRTDEIHNEKKRRDVMGGVVFYLYHCPAQPRSASSLQPGEPTCAIYQWWVSWFPTLRTLAPQIEVVWLGLQQQARFLASMGWLRHSALCADFAPPLGMSSNAAGEDKKLTSTCDNPESRGSPSRVPAPHDPLIALWMLHPEIDTSPIVNAKVGALMLPALLRTFPCPSSQEFLSAATTPPPLLASIVASGHKKKDHSRPQCVLLFVPELEDVIDSNRTQAPGALAANVYTRVAHEESMSCLASAALAIPLLQLLRHEDLYNSYAERESWMPLICAQMELAGVGFDPTYYPPLMQLMQTKVHELTSYAYEVVGRSNWSLTSPRDCAVALYDDLRLPCLHYLGDLDRQHHKDGGAAPLPRRRRLLRENRSTKASVLVHLSRLYPDNPLPPLLMEFRRLDGWTEKYMDPLQKGAVLVRRQASSSSGGGSSGLGRRIYGRIYTTSTATGRLAMSEPSLQTIPHPVTFELHGKTVSVNLRRALIPGVRRSPTLTPLLNSLEKRDDEEQKGGGAKQSLVEEDTLLFLSADYSHIEARLLAHFSGDEALLAAFPLDTLRSLNEENDVSPFIIPQRDIFKELAADLFEKSGVEEVTAEERRIAKSIWYGVMYGRGKNSLANELYLSVEAAERFLHRIRHKYSTTLRCMANMAEEAAERGFVRTLLGRKRWIPRMTTHRRPDVTLQERGGWNAFERVAINTLCQASAADIMKEAMVRIALDPLFQGCGASPPVARLILQVHDELLFEVKKKAIPHVVETLKQHMNLTEQLHLRVPLVINFQCGRSWGEMDSL